MANKHVFLKGIYFERNLETGEMEVYVESNHGTFVLRSDVLDFSIIHSVLDYIKGKSVEVISRHVAEQMQRELEKSPEDRAREALGLEAPIEVEDDNG